MNDTATEFAVAAERLFTDLLDPETIDAAEADVFPEAVWRAVNESGFGLALVPESKGGVGASLREAAAILSGAGAHAAPGPILELMLGNQILAQAGYEPVDRPLALVFADGTALTGSVVVRNVPWLGHSSRCLVAVPTDSGAVMVTVLPTHALRHGREIENAGGEPESWVELPGSADWAELSDTKFEELIGRAALLRGAQMLGAMQWCLQRSAEYSQERRQFGRAIAGFQAVQQMMAEMAASVMAAGAILDAAVHAPHEPSLVAAARARLGDAADTVFSFAHQVHGAIGFSHEYVLHYRTRRLMAWRDQFGTVAHWREMLAKRFVGLQADDVWPCLTATEGNHE